MNFITKQLFYNKNNIQSSIEISSLFLFNLPVHPVDLSISDKKVNKINFRDEPALKKFSDSLTSDNTITTIFILCTHRYTWWPSLASIDACVSEWIYNLAFPIGEKYVSEAEELDEWHRLPTGPLRGDLPKCCQFPVSVSRSSLASGFYFDFFPSIEACNNTKQVTLVFIYIPDFFQRKFVSLIHWGEKTPQYCWIEILYLMITSWSW